MPCMNIGKMGKCMCIYASLINALMYAQTVRSLLTSYMKALIHVIIR